MKHVRKSDIAISALIRLGLLKFLSVLTLGIFGGLGDFWKFYGTATRRAFWQNYVIVPVLLSVLGFAVFRILNVHGFLSPLNYEMRRIVLGLILSPAIFSHSLGQIKRLRDMRLPPLLALLNFIPLYGTLALILFCGIFSGMPARSVHRPKGF